MNAYQTQAASFEDLNRVVEATRAHAALGLAGEAGEVVELVKKDLFHGRPLDVHALRLEIGDVLWHLASLCTAYGITLQSAAEANLSKLEARYPNGFVLGGGVR